jgi:PQQ-dependent dehydrogenase (s-GDH family)
MRVLTGTLVALVALYVAPNVDVSSAAALQGPTTVARAPERFTLRVVASGLASPWEIAWGPDGQLWVTEREGRRVLQVNPADGVRRVLLTMHEVHQSVTQDGLLGLAFHPDFSRGSGSDFVYLAFTYDDAPGPALARRLGIRRYRFDQGTRTLTDPVDVLVGLPTHDDHVGGRLAIGPDRKLYLTIGDQGSNFGGNRCNPNRAQEIPTAADVTAKTWSRYQGKILRVDLDGGIPSDNPVIGGVRSHVFTAGHRNPLGLAFGPGGRLYESEHGPSSDDEVNLLESGRNYGWPNVAGHKDDKAYTFANWSASAPQACAALPPGGGNAIPASVPQQTESSWTHALFAPPLQTFFTVDSGFDMRQGATMAPGGIDVYTGTAIPGWNNSLLALSLLRGVVFKMTLSADGRSTVGPPLETLKTTNRYRDIAIAPDQRRFYVITDVGGRTTDANGVPTLRVENPGSILEFTYEAN